MREKRGLPKAVKIAIVSVLGFIALCTTILAIAIPSSTNATYDDDISDSYIEDDYYIDEEDGTVKKPKTVVDEEDELEEVEKSNKKVTSRTIMVYVAGNNLESEAKIATAELESFDYSTLANNNTKVYIYTGGTKYWWNNYILPTEEAIYELTASGYEKKKVYSLGNIARVNGLTNFLNYCYENSKTDAYDLIFDDHGGASAGVIWDENNGDHLELAEIKSALKNSPFNSKNKLEMIIFRTCLNATVEVASVLYPYADYMLASEEITWGNAYYPLISVYNDVTIDTTPVDVSKAFITRYDNFLKDMNAYYRQSDSTYEDKHVSYSIVDLTKIPGLIKKMNTFFAKVDVNKNYNDIARIRANLYQYGVNDQATGVSSYDAVDLYELVDGLKGYNSSAADDILKYIQNEVVSYNWANTDHSHGLTVFFPFTSGDNREYFLGVYNQIPVSKNYKNVINQFYKNQISASYSYSFDLSNNEIKESENEYKIKLTKKQQKYFAKAGYVVFDKNEDGTYSMVYKGIDAKLDKKGYVSTNLSNKLVGIVDEEDGYFYPIVWQVDAINKGFKEFIVEAWLYKNDPGTGLTTEAKDVVYIHLLVDKNNNISMGTVEKVQKDEITGIYNSIGVPVNINDYVAIDFNQFHYNVIDQNGDYTPDWEGSHIAYVSRYYVKDLKFEYIDIDINDFYCSFVIRDTQNKYYYSNLIGKE